MQEFIKLVEVSPRDGLQNESMIVPTATKIEFINRLSKTGLSVIEASSFVSPEKIPQTADASEVLNGIEQSVNVSYPVLVPNITGLEQAISAGATSISFFTAASNTFTEKNINCTIEESFARLQEMLPLAAKHDIQIRAYISCCLGCPYEGDIDINTVADIAYRLHQLGCYEISLGDTIGVGTPKQARRLIEAVKQKTPIEIIAAHFHDTYGQALANLYAVIQSGIRIIDSSVAGLGGCPYAKGASGNVASEDVLYMLNGLNFQTNVNLNRLVEAGEFICSALDKNNLSKVAIAMKN